MTAHPDNGAALGWNATIGPRARIHSGPSPLEAALHSVDIITAWHALGLPGDPGKSCRSPFRDERSPSFSVFDNGRRWKDFSTGDGGDVLDFVAAALDCDKTRAAHWLIEYAGTRKAPSMAARRPHKAPQEPRRPLTLPALDGGTYGEILTLQRLRKLPMNAGLEILRERGILFFADLPQGRAWLITDNARTNAQARLLSGAPFRLAGKEFKAKTLPGSAAAWPIGLADCREREIVLLCEGAPDLLSAATAAWLERTGDLGRIGFACMVGGTLAIPPEALEVFAGKRVRIFGHADAPGRAAVSRWWQQLDPVAGQLDCWLSDTEGHDLNDHVSAHPEAIEAGTYPEPLTPEPTHKEASEAPTPEA